MCGRVASIKSVAASLFHAWRRLCYSASRFQIYTLPTLRRLKNGLLSFGTDGQGGVATVIKLTFLDETSEQLR